MLSSAVKGLSQIPKRSIITTEPFLMGLYDLFAWRQCLELREVGFVGGGEAAERTYTDHRSCHTIMSADRKSVV